VATGALVTSIGGLRGSRSPANCTYAALCSGGSSLTTMGCSLRSAACVQVHARLIRTSCSFGLVERRAQRIASSAQCRNSSALDRTLSRLSGMPLTDIYTSRAGACALWAARVWSKLLSPRAAAEI